MVVHEGRRVHEIAWDDPQAVVVRTTDQGPFREDVFFDLTTTSGECVSIGQEVASLEPDFLLRLQALSGFDNEAFIRAMGSTDNAAFPCWSR